MATICELVSILLCLRRYRSVGLRKTVSIRNGSASVPNASHSQAEYVHNETHPFEHASANAHISSIASMESSDVLCDEKKKKTTQTIYCSVTVQTFD